MNDLRWQPSLDGEFIVSECGRYTVARPRVSGRTLYEAWQRGDPSKMLACRLANSDAAKRVCERHAGRS